MVEWPPSSAAWVIMATAVSHFSCVCVCTFFACLIFVLAALSHAFVLRISSVMTHEKHRFFCRVVFNFSFFFRFPNSSVSLSGLILHTKPRRE